MVSNINLIGNYSVTDNGVIIPDTADVQETVQNEYKDQFGQDLSVEESTPQGRLIDVETTARQNTIRFNALMANVLINISRSSGAALDAWGANFNIERKGATSSTVNVSVTGVPNTVIPANSQASAEDGTVWQSLNEIILDENGNGTGIFYCSQTGPIPLGVGQLTNIIASNTTGVVGWETVINTTPALVGSELESDFDYRNRIINSIFNGTALFGNYSSAVNKVDGVKDVYAYDNPNGFALQLDNISIPAHSVYVCVDGGNNENVAYALYSVKSAGAGWSGNTSVVVKDKTYLSTNTVTFQTPLTVEPKLLISVTSLENSNADLTEVIQNTIINYSQGAYSESGFSKLGIRAFISPFIIASMLKSQISGIEVNQILLGLEEPVPHAVVTIKKASITSGTLWASVNSETFAEKVVNNGTYNFTYNGTEWLLNNQSVSLSEYGINVIANDLKPVTGDIVSVVFATGEMSQSSINLFATEVPQFLAENIQVVING